MQHVIDAAAGTSRPHGTGTEGFHWAGTNCIDANSTRAKFVCCIAHGGLKGGLAQTHQVVASDDFLAAVVTQGHDATAIGH